MSHDDFRAPLRPYQLRLLEIATLHGLTWSDIRGRYRGRRQVDARIEAVAYLRGELDWSYSRIGRVLGGRDHSTIMHLWRLSASGRRSWGHDAARAP